MAAQRPNAAWQLTSNVLARFEATFLIWQISHKAQIFGFLREGGNPSNT
jgi:hypothetical protein